MTTPSSEGNPEAGTAGVETISTLERLDEKLQQVEAARLISDDKMREVFGGFRMAPPSDLPRTPTARSTARQFDLYRMIAGPTPYEVQNENRTSRSTQPAVPVLHREPRNGRPHLMAIGSSSGPWRLPPGSSILELGPGWGNTTIDWPAWATT